MGGQAQESGWSFELWELGVEKRAPISHLLIDQNQRLYLINGRKGHMDAQDGVASVIFGRSPEAGRVSESYRNAKRLTSEGNRVRVAIDFQPPIRVTGPQLMLGSRGP